MKGELIAFHIQEDSPNQSPDEVAWRLAVKVIFHELVVRAMHARHTQTDENKIVCLLLLFLIRESIVAMHLGVSSASHFR